DRTGTTRHRPVPPPPVDLATHAAQPVGHDQPVADGLGLRPEGSRLRLLVAASDTERAPEPEAVMTATATQPATELDRFKAGEPGVYESIPAVVYHSLDACS